MFWLIRFAKEVLEQSKGCCYSPLYPRQCRGPRFRCRFRLSLLPPAEVWACRGTWQRVLCGLPVCPGGIPRGWQSRAPFLKEKIQGAKPRFSQPAPCQCCPAHGAHREGPSLSPSYFTAGKYFLTPWSRELAALSGSAPASPSPVAARCTQRHWLLYLQ